MCFPDIGQEIANIASDVYMWGLDTSNDLNTHQLSFPLKSEGIAYLRNDFQPCIDLHSRETVGHCIADDVMCTKLEP
jgi:hypothetical protein